MTTPSERVAQLVRVNFGGNVMLAADFIGVPHRTLFRIVSGKAKGFRVSTLERVAAGLGASAAWLLSGVGESPLPDTRAIELYALPKRELVRRLCALTKQSAPAPKATAPLSDLARSLPEGPERDEQVRAEDIDIHARYRNTGWWRTSYTAL